MANLLTLQETDSPPTHGIGGYAAYLGIGTSSSTWSRQATIGGTVGTGTTSINNSGAGTNLATIMFESAPGDMDGTSFLANSLWGVQIDVQSGSGAATVHGVWFLRVNSAGTVQQTITSNTGGFGSVVPGTLDIPILGNTVSFATGDLVVVIVSFDWASASMVGLKPDLTVYVAPPFALDDGSESGLTFGIRTEW